MVEETKYMTKEEHEEILQEELNELEKSLFDEYANFTMFLCSLSASSLLAIAMLNKSVFNKWKR